MTSDTIYLKLILPELLTVNNCTNKKLILVIILRFILFIRLFLFNIFQNQVSYKISNYCLSSILNTNVL